MRLVSVKVAGAVVCMSDGAGRVADYLVALPGMWVLVLKNPPQLVPEE